ncbi:MAG: DUF4168 domain-containing protein [Alphaproteobacteria bacterium]
MGHHRSNLSKGLLAGAFAAGMSVAGASLALAQSSGASPATPPSAAAASITQQELKTFAVAALEVKKINDTYRPRYQSAETPAAKEQVRKEATEKMSSAVQQQGLSVDKYNQIVRVAQADPEVAKQIDDYARQAN